MVNTVKSNFGMVTRETTSNCILVAVNNNTAINPKISQRLMLELGLI